MRLAKGKRSEWLAKPHGRAVSSTCSTLVRIRDQILGLVSKVASCWSWRAGYATGAVTHGHSSWSPNNHLGWSDRGVWAIPTNTLFKISRTGIGILLRPFPDHIPKCCRCVRCRHCYQVFWSRRQLSHYNWRFDAWRGKRLQRSRWRCSLFD